MAIEYHSHERARLVTEHVVAEDHATPTHRLTVERPAPAVQRLRRIDVVRAAGPPVANQGIEMPAVFDGYYQGDVMIDEALDHRLKVRHALEC